MDKDNRWTYLCNTVHICGSGFYSLNMSDLGDDTISKYHGTKQMISRRGCSVFISKKMLQGELKISLKLC